VFVHSEWCGPFDEINQIVASGTLTKAEMDAQIRVILDEAQKKGCFQKGLVNFLETLLG